MIDVCPVSQCDSPRHRGWAICKPCAESLRKNVAEAPSVAAELETTLARLRSNAPRDGGHGARDSLPYVPEATEALYVLRNTLVGWIRDLEDDVRRHPLDTFEAMASWLLSRFNDLLVHPAAEQVVEEIAAAVGRPVGGRPKTWLVERDENGNETTWTWSTGKARIGEALYDNPAPQTFLGPCPSCEAADLYVAEGKPEVRCPSCGAEHQVAILRDGLRDAMSDRLMSAAEAANGLALLGEVKDRDRARVLINVWANRGRIAIHPGPRYRFGEIQQLMGERQHAHREGMSA